MSFKVNTVILNCLKLKEITNSESINRELTLENIAYTNKLHVQSKTEIVLIE